MRGLHVFSFYCLWGMTITSMRRNNEDLEAGRRRDRPCLFVRNEEKVEALEGAWDRKKKVS